MPLRAWQAEDLTALERLNELRTVEDQGGERNRLERFFTAEFRANHRLAVYGTLAPGRSNHDQLAGLKGTWTSGLQVHGRLTYTGWGAAYGHPALAWSIDGEPVETQLFTCAQLPERWPRLDEFEGPDYLRILVPVFRDDQVIEVANLYSSAGALRTPEPR